MQELSNNTVIVYDSYKLSDGRIIAFLKSNSGKIPVSSLLKDKLGRQWIVKQYYWTTNSFEGYEKIRVEEEQNIFQYLLVGINQYDKPTKESILTVFNENHKAL